MFFPMSTDAMPSLRTRKTTVLTAPFSSARIDQKRLAPFQGSRRTTSSTPSRRTNVARRSYSAGAFQGSWIRARAARGDTRPPPSIFQSPSTESLPGSASAETVVAWLQSASKGEGPDIIRAMKNMRSTVTGISAAGSRLIGDFFFFSVVFRGAVGGLSPSHEESWSAKAIASGKRSSGFFESACMQIASIALFSVLAAQVGDALDGGVIGSYTTR